MLKAIVQSQTFSKEVCGKVYHAYKPILNVFNNRFNNKEIVYGHKLTSCDLWFLIPKAVFSSCRIGFANASGQSEKL